MMYVIKRDEDGKYVACSGSGSSYTNDRAHAATFRTKEAAQKEACSNESIWYSMPEEYVGK